MTVWHFFEPLGACRSQIAVVLRLARQMQIISALGLMEFPMSQQLLTSPRPSRNKVKKKATSVPSYSKLVRHFTELQQLRQKVRVAELGQKNSKASAQ